MPDDLNEQLRLAAETESNTARAALWRRAGEGVAERDTLRAELAAATAQRDRLRSLGTAMTRGWADRDQGVAADACPHAMDEEQRQMWAKGWQWRDDQLALAAALADLARVTAENEVLFSHCVFKATHDGSWWTLFTGVSDFGTEREARAAVLAIGKKGGG